MLMIEFLETEPYNDISVTKFLDDEPDNDISVTKFLDQTFQSFLQWATSAWMCSENNKNETADWVEGVR